MRWWRGGKKSQPVFFVLEKKNTKSNLTANYESKNKYNFVHIFFFNFILRG